MNIQEPLTKENFWDVMMEKYPKATKHFCDWIHEYKKAVNWDFLFFNNRKASRQSKCRTNPINFHDIPHSMQQGIWIEFISQNLHRLFEQPEYVYCGDLREDINIVFYAIEPVLNP